ncbi:flagellar hook-associated protein FlgL [Paenibacillus sp. NPDC056579]|uniref:flagellar hook-associated protein FlgL n=1 Tax=Paenibacillus sp. NPDC056579 TaxID=3345871 RepID=UPI00369DFBC7
MALRVTQGMIQTQFLRNVSNNISVLNNYENQLSTGRKINKPSDDPVGITYALRYRSDLSMNEQYQKNIDTATSSIEHVDTVLNQINDVMQRVKELGTRGLNGTNPQSALDAIAKEMGQLFDETVTLGNIQLNGKYTFNGQQTDKKPYTTDNAQNESTDTGHIVYQFAAGVTIPINITGNEVFGTNAEEDNLFKVIKGLQDAFNAGEKEAAGDMMDLFNSRMDKFLNTRAEVGARANRVELLDNRLKDLNLNLESLSGKTEDADYAETLIKLKTKENVYQASLSIGAKIIQPSLVDYLR